MKQKSRKEQIEHSINYIAFLEKRLNSEHYKAVTSTDNLMRDKEKLKKEKLILKLLS